MNASPNASGPSPFTHAMGELIKGEALTIAVERPVVEAARRMSEAGVGSLVVTEGDTPVGIVTKTDLMRRVLATGSDPAAPVRDFLTRGLISIERDHPIFEGLMLMIQHGISHLAVMEEGRLAGVVSERDWLIFQERQPAALLHRMDAATSVAELAELRRRANALVRTLFGDDGHAEALTRLVTEINDRVSRRVIALCLQDLTADAGSAPAPFAWIAMGSEGRAEQTLATDQDNGLVFQDVPEAEREGVQGWFLRLAARVVDGLEACGFPRCKGNVMASNPELCQPLAAWRGKFSGYLREADPEALLRASIHFDFRCLYGEAGLVEALRSHLLGELATQRGFLRHLAGVVMEGRPPVHPLRWRLRALLRLRRPPLDTKKQGLAPIVASLRVLALAVGAPQTNTLARLEAVRAAGALPQELARSVKSAYDFLMLLRLRLHFQQQARGLAPSNLLLWEELNPLRRRFLAEALQTVKDLQDHVFDQYGGVTQP